MSKKYRQVKVNFLPEDYEQIEKYAKREGLTVAAFLRKCVGVDMEENRRLPKGAKKKTVSDVKFSLLYHLSKIDTSIYQIAKHCNTEKAVDRQALFALEKIHNEIWSVPNVSEN